MAENVRIDKWLWAVRVYKTRNMAAEACRSGKVRINDQPVKPSRTVTPGDRVKVTVNPQFTRTLKVREILSNRVSAKLVPDFAEDLTPQEEYDKLKVYNALLWERRDRGIGRPTKKQRRDIDRLKNF
jgi:ribosome-associated heat shock protein Hsp15